MINVVPYKSTGTFRHWCMKVLPTVYDDSLSYYELLCKVVNYLNDLIKNVDGLHEDVEQIAKYLNGLSIDKEVERLLDEMVIDGRLDEIVTRALMGIDDFVGIDKEWNVHKVHNSVDLNQRLERTLHYEPYLADNGTRIFALAPTIYRPLDMPIANATASVSLDGYLGVPVNVAITNKSTLSFRNIIFDRDGYNEDLTLVNSMHVYGQKAVPPNLPQNIKSDNRTDVIRVAKTYLKSVEDGREYRYGLNFVNSSQVKTVNDSEGNGVMECDTFVALVLMGVPYDKSPYADDTPNKIFDFTKLNVNPDSKVWCLPWKFDTIYGRKITYTGAQLWWLWYKNCVYKDYTKLETGDVIIFRKDSGKYFDGITHIGIAEIHYEDGEKIPYIYHFSGAAEIGNNHMRVEPLSDVVERGHYNMDSEVYYARPNYSVTYDPE